MKNKKNIFPTILRFAMLALCGAVLGLNLYMFNANKLVGNKLPMPFGYGAAVVLSGSMEPAFSTGDLIIVKESADYAVDDVVVYQDGNMLVTHRIIAIDGTQVTTQGDANNVADPAVDIKDIKGTVVYIVPAVGKVVSFLKTPVGIISLVALTVFTTESSFRKEKEADSEELEKIKEEIRRLKDGE